jgi:hypothetical protein
VLKGKKHLSYFCQSQISEEKANSLDRTESK